MRSWQTIWTRVWPGLSELSIVTETLLEVSDPLGSSTGISKWSMSMIADGRNEDACEQAVISVPTISTSQLIIAFPKMVFKCSYVSSCLFLVCRSSLITKIFRSTLVSQRKVNMDSFLQKKSPLYLNEGYLKIL